MLETVIRCRTCEDVRVLVSRHTVDPGSSCPRCAGGDRARDTIRGKDAPPRHPGVTLHLQSQAASGRAGLWASTLLERIREGARVPWLIPHEIIDTSGGTREVLAGLARCGYVAWVSQGGIAVRLIERDLTPLPGLDHKELLARWSAVIEGEPDELESWLEALPGHEDERWQRLLVTTRLHLSTMECLVIARHLALSHPGLELMRELGLDPFMLNEHDTALKDIEHVRRLLDRLVVTDPRSPWTGRMGRMTRALRKTLRERWYAREDADEGFIPDEPDALDRALVTRGFASWRTPSQREATRLILDGVRDGVVVLPTGHGKTLCFDLASECMAPGDYILVISPLLALMSQQDHALGSRSVWFRGGMDEDDLWDNLEALEEVDIALVSPELVSSSRFLDQLTEHRLPRRIVIDEAHCVLEWGNGFRPEYLNLGRIRERLEEHLGAPIPMIALTATLTQANHKELIDVLGLRQACLVRESADRPELWFEGIEILTSRERVDFIENFLGRHRHMTGIIRVAMARGGHPLSAESLAAHLGSRGLAVEAFHARLSGATQSELIERLASRELQALVATSSFGMGMDLPWLEWVIHAQPSTSVADYLQGAGRAGRGMDVQLEQAMCLVLGSELDRRDLSQQLYYHLPREETLRHMLEGWLRSPHAEPQPGVYVDAEAAIITLDTRRQHAQSAAIRYAIRKGTLEYVCTSAGHLLAFRIPDDPKVWSNFYTARERDRAAVDREWLQVMELILGSRCRRAQVLEVFGDQPSPSYPRCCDVCDGSMYAGGS